MKRSTYRLLGWTMAVVAAVLWASPFDFPGPVEEIIATYLAWWLLERGT